MSAIQSVGSIDDAALQPGRALPHSLGRSWIRIELDVSGALEADSVLAGYRVTGLLGRGGMGFVYEAEHLLLRRKAALKTLAPELGGGADFRERFIRESQTVASIDHPNIIPIYDAGDHEGLVYIAMRYVKGPDLEKLIKEGGTHDPHEALSILEQVAGALDAAHSAR